MARIRTIKPEFPQSESMGRVSRDARLLFVELWTLCDDLGRTRAASRMLASLLFPYDDDAPALIDGWLAELEREQCVVRYAVDGATYLQVCNWLNHQKIDKPSGSKIPPFDESSRILSNPREQSSEDQGSRTKEGIKEKSLGSPSAPAEKKGTRLPEDWKLPDEWAAWARTERRDVDPVIEGAKFADYWHGIPGAKGRKSDWLGTWRNWIRNAKATPKLALVSGGDYVYKPLPGEI